MEQLTGSPIVWYPGLDDLQAGIKIAGRNINNLRYKDDTTLMAESKEELKKGQKLAALTDFLFLGSKITVDDDYSCEIRR